MGREGSGRTASLVRTLAAVLSYPLVGELGGVVREHLGSTSWTSPIFKPVLLDSVQCSWCARTQMCPYAFFQNCELYFSASVNLAEKAREAGP